MPKLSESDATTVMSAVVLGVVPYLEQRTVPLLALRDGGPEVFSGTFVSLGGRYFICTAAHCIRDCELHQITLVLSRHPTKERTPFIASGWRGGGDKDEVDVGWLELEARVAASLQCRFVPAEQITLNVHEVMKDMVVLSGAPAGIVPQQLARRGRYQLHCLHYVTLTKPVHRWPSTCRQEYDIVLDYPDHDNVLVSNVDFPLPDAPGFSGGGIWALNINKGGLWSPDCLRLIAVDHSWSEGARYVRGCQIQHWLDLLRRDTGIQITT